MDHRAIRRMDDGLEMLWKPPRISPLRAVMSMRTDAEVQGRAGQGGGAGAGA